MAKRRLLVTGMGGFVGTVLADTLAAAKWADRFEPVALAEFGGAAVDLRDADGVERAIVAARPDAVIHLAAVAAPRQAKEDPAAAWQVNVMGTFHLACAVMRHAPEARFIFAGSSEAYGAAFNRSGKEAGAPLGEDAALQPLSAYGATKAAADIMLRQMAFDGLDVTVFRPFNHTGPGQSPNYVVPAFATQIARIEAGLQEPVMKVGNLEAERDFLDVRDVVDAYLTAASRERRADDPAGGQVLNLSTGRPVAIARLLAIMTDMASVPVSVEVDPARYLPNTIPVMSGDNTRAAAVLGWAPSIPLEQTLSEILAWARAEARG